MAATEKNDSIIQQVKLSQAKVPWCEEFEKMISGMNFQSRKAPVMSEYKVNIMRQLVLFNDPHIFMDSTMQSLQDSRMAVASKIMGKMGSSVIIEKPFFCIWGCNIFLGDKVYMNRKVEIHDNAPVHIGDNVLIGPGVCICTATHVTGSAERRETYASFALPIVVGDDCWIGARATVLPGAIIRKGTTVAAGAVVAGEVEGHVLAGGVPAKVIKRLDM